MKVISKLMYMSLFVSMVSSTGNLLYGQEEGFDWQESNSPQSIENSVPEEYDSDQVTPMDQPESIDGEYDEEQWQHDKEEEEGLEGL